MRRAGAALLLCLLLCGCSWKDAGDLSAVTAGTISITQIIVIDLVRKIPTPVNIRFCICRLNRQLSVDGFYIGIIKCIDVNCHAQTVF